MNYILNKIANLLKVKTERDYHEEYLAQSTSLVDVERRLRNIQNKPMSDWV